MKRKNPWWVDMIVVLFVTVAAVISGSAIPISVKSPAWLPCSMSFVVAIVVVVYFWIGSKFLDWLGNPGKKPLSQPPPRPTARHTRLLGRRIWGRFGAMSPRDGPIAAHMAVVKDDTLVEDIDNGPPLPDGLQKVIAGVFWFFLIATAVCALAGGILWLFAREWSDTAFIWAGRGALVMLVDFLFSYLSICVADWLKRPHQPA